METKTSTLSVEGMTCNACVARVNRALRSVDGVRNVDVHLRERKVTVEHDASTDPLAMTGALEEAGYPAQTGG